MSMLRQGLASERILSLGSLHRNASRLTLFARHAGFREFSFSEMKEALAAIGVDGFERIRSKEHLVNWMHKVRIPFEVFTGALHEVRRNDEVRRSESQQRSSGRQKSNASGSRKGDRRSGQGKGGREGFQAFSDGQLRMTLNSIGIFGTAGWPTSALVQQLKEMGIKPKDVQLLVREFGGGSGQASPKTRNRQTGGRRGGGGGGARSRNGRAKQQRPPRSWAEQEFYEDIGGWRVHNEFIHEDHIDFEGWDDDDDDDDYDDYFDFTLDEDPWDAVMDWGDDEEDYTGGWRYEDPPWQQPSWNQSRTRSRFRTYSVHEDYNTGSPSSASSQSAYASPSKPLDPEEAMARALQQGWKAENLSRLQASQLLGFSGSAEQSEVTKMRRKLALRWHPDKNPGNDKAAVAFQLVMAAASKLSP